MIFSPRPPTVEADSAEDLDLTNPFEDNADDPDRLVLGKSRIQAGTIIDGYIKFHNGKSRPANLPRRQAAMQPSDPQALLSELCSQTFLFEAGLEDNCDKNLFQFCESQYTWPTWRMANVLKTSRHGVLVEVFSTKPTAG